MSTLPWHVDLPPVRRWIDWMTSSGKGDAAWERVAAWERMVQEHGVVRTSVEGRVGTIELSYPPKGNALVPPMYRLFVRALQELEERDEVWVIVITGAGKSFSTGGYVGSDAFYAGLDAGDGGSAPEPMRRTFVEMFQPMARHLYNCEKPTIAMINGMVAAEAIDIALAADLRTARPASELWFSFARTGNTAYTGCGWLLPRMIGVSQASRLLLTAARIDGVEAHRLGLISVLAGDDELASATTALADHVASLPPVTLRLIKKQIHRGLEIGSFDTNLDLTSMIEPIVQATRDHMDAEEAIIEKRDPVVRGF
jgi:enoyl-CoA hydratase/carnithine racemase